jgi:transcriptional regulator with XRE-family HTH domain
MENNIDLFINFRRNLELLRIEKGLSTEQLSNELGMTKKRIVDIEYGKKGRGVPKAKELFNIAKFFNVTVEDLVHKKAKIILI